MPKTVLLVNTNGQFTPKNATLTYGDYFNIADISTIGEAVSDIPPDNDDGSSEASFGLGSPLLSLWGMRVIKPSLAGLQLDTGVNNIQINCRARRGGVGGGASVGFFVSRSGDTFDITPTTALSTSYITFSTTLIADPTTDRVWDMADLENEVLEFGIRHTTGGSNVLFTSFWLVIDHQALGLWNKGARVGTEWEEGVASSLISWYTPPAGSNSWSRE